MKPFIKVGHRYGNVFLRLVRMERGFRTTTLIKLSPEEAKEIAGQLGDCAKRAAGEPVKWKTLKVRR